MKVAQFAKVEVQFPDVSWTLASVLQTNGKEEDEQGHILIQHEDEAELSFIISLDTYKEERRTN